VSGRVVLFGEVHDNTALHALRIEIVRAAIKQGARPSLAFEQFDRDQQSRIDALRAAKRIDSATDAAQFVSAMNSGRTQRSSWQWPQYLPLIQLALDHDLPIIAANLSRADAMRVGSAAADNAFNIFSAAETATLGLDRPISSTLFEAQQREVKTGHCDLMPSEALAPTARAQIARDAVMANALQSKSKGVILFAGNGHTRRDIGVAQWLPQHAQLTTIGMLETTHSQIEKKSAYTQFDVVFYAAPQPREDQCEALRKRMQAPTVQVKP
jgi:uncharacterized iron-regulated protein